MKPAILIAGILLATAGCGSRSPAWEALPIGTKADFHAVWFADAMHGWIAGGSYEITGGFVGRTSDGGKTWRFVSNLTKRDRMSVTAVHFFDTERGIAATSSGPMLSTSDAGEHWTLVDKQDASTNCPVCFPSTSAVAGSRAIQFIDDRNGWVAGMQASLARTADGGVTWEPVSTPIVGSERPNFWDVSFIDSQYGWVVGEEGSMLSTTDGGITWTRRSTGLKDAHSAPKLERIPRAGGTVTVDAGDRTPGFTISAVRFIDRNRGWITGFYAGLGRSLILRTDDAGANWVVDADIAGEELYALFVQKSDTAWAIGARVREGPQAIYRRSIAGK